MPSTAPVPARLDRDALIAWYRRNRAWSRQLFDLVEPSAYYSRPIALRNPIVFYEGHLPAFSVIAFLRRALGAGPVDERLEQLFARGIDPENEATAVPRSGASTIWPPREEVLAFGAAADRAVIDAIASATFDESRPAITNLLTIYQLLTDKTPEECVANFEGKGYGQFKTELADAAIEFLRPFQERVREFDDSALEAIMKAGAEKARSIASVTLADVYAKTGIR